ncbi:hypothetical protein [Actinoplanes subglobosus]|uniref:Lipoprotein n=1 Tax=Actinoplanes subglobosus TaxID=1547892 RepID=A0ABV8IPB9_9ACTN
MALLGGCGPGPAQPVEPGAVPSEAASEAAPAGEPRAEETARLQKQAREALQRWDRAVEAAGGAPRFVPVGPLTGQIGDWEPALAANAKMSLGNGHLTIIGRLPVAPEARGEVVWEGGVRETVPLLSAEDALGRITAGWVECPGCVPLEITGARLGTTRVETTRGPATVPAWEFTVKGSRVRITRPAAGGSGTVQVTPPSWDPYNSPAGLAITSAGTTVGGRNLTAGFTGAPRDASEPCGIDYTAVAVEADTAVVVYILERHHAEGESCTAIGHPRTASVELAAPLGERAVLEVTQGLPVPVTITS